MEVTAATYDDVKAAMKLHYTKSKFSRREVGFVQHDTERGSNDCRLPDRTAKKRQDRLRNTAAESAWTMHFVTGNGMQTHIHTAGNSERNQRVTGRCSAVR